MKLPTQPPERRPIDETNHRLGGSTAATVRPAGPIECMLCKAACQILPEPGKSACLMVCDATVC